MRLHQSLTTVLLALVIVLSLATYTSALPVTVERVEIDDIELSPFSINRLDVVRDQTVEVEVRFSSPVNLDDVELEVFFSGYEYNDVEPLADRTAVFDMDAGVTYVKRLQIPLTGDVEEDDYKLRVMFTDRNDPVPAILSFPIKIDVPRHLLMIEDVIFSPSGIVQAGNALLATVRLENKGEKDQDDVKVSVTLSQLLVSGADYIDTIEAEEEEETEEIFLRIPPTAKSGKYDVTVEVNYDEGHRKIVKAYPLTIQGDPRYEDGGSGAVAGGAKAGTTVTLGSTLESATIGETSAIYPVTITNQGRNSRTYTLRITNSDWADVRVTPTSTMIVNSGESKLFTITVTPQQNSPQGAQVLTAELVEGQKTLKDIQFTTNIKQGATGLTTAKQALQIALVVLLVLLVIIVLVLAFKGLGGGEKNIPQPETYY